jgi:hypothetical protein
MTIDAGDLHGIPCGHEVHMRVTETVRSPGTWVTVEFHDEDEERP